MKIRTLSRLFPLIGLVLVASPATATVFDFEELAFTSLPGLPNGLLTSLSSTRDGITLDISRTSGAAFDLAVIGSPTFPASWDNRTLDPFFAEETNDYFLGNFSVPVLSVTLAMTDFFDDDDNLELLAYSGPDATGALVGSDMLFWSVTSSSPDFVTLTVSGGSIQSILFRGGSDDFPNSMYVDNIEVEPVPEPSAALLLALGLLALGRARAR